MCTPKNINNFIKHKGEKKMKRKFITIIFWGLFLVIVFTVKQALFKGPLSNLNETESTDQIQSLEEANSSKKTEDTGKEN